MDTSTLALQPFHRGAEADLFLSTMSLWKVVIKRRIEKKYRHSSLDQQIRRDRTIGEASLLHEAKVTGARVPSLLGVDIDENCIVMTYLSGNLVRDSLDEMKTSITRKLFTELGSQVGFLHAGGIVHGDLTTSNLIATPTGVPFILDFGMSRRSLEPEDRGVDLHLLQRSIATSHTGDHLSDIRAVARGYAKAVGPEMARSTLRKAAEIAKRGRYFALR